jgi:hypothetical protein
MSDTQKLESLILELTKSVKNIESEMSSMKSGMGSMKSEMNTRFDGVDTRLDRIETWNDKAFSAIEDLRTELKSDGAATRGMIYEAYEQISDMRDVLEKRTPIQSPTMNRYPRVPVIR